LVRGLIREGSRVCGRWGKGDQSLKSLEVHIYTYFNKCCRRKIVDNRMTDEDCMIARNCGISIIDEKMHLTQSEIPLEINVNSSSEIRNSILT